MRKIIVHCSTGYCGSDSWEALLVPASYTNAAIDTLAYDMAVENYEMYGFEPLDDEEEDYTTVEYTWYDYDPELHDMYRTGGGSFEEDF